jgi:serine/threonine protein kinase
MLDILTKIKPKNRKEWFTSISPDALDLISKTLHFNPDKRPTMQEILMHPFMKEFFTKKEVVEAT